MPVLTELAVADLQAMSWSLRDVDSGHRSMSEAAGEVTALLHGQLLAAGGEPACAAVRIHATQRLSDLPARLAQAALEVDPAATPATTCLVRLASSPEPDPAAERPEEVALPLTSTVLEGIPLMPQLLEQIGLDLDAVADPSRAIAVRLQHRSFNVYLASDLADDEVLLPNPAHRALIRERGVQSLVAAAGVLPTGGLLLIVFQTQVRVDERVADMLRPLATSVKAALTPWALHIFTDGPRGSR